MQTIFWPDNAQDDRPRCDRKKITLYGLGGAGKSEVALEYAHRNSKNYEVIFWLNMQSPAELKTSAGSAMISVIDYYAANWNDSSTRFQDIALALNIFEKKIKDYKDLVKAANKSNQLLRRWLPQDSSHPWLLILDDYGDPKSCSLDAILPTTDVGHVLITSRNPNIVEDSQVVEVPMNLGEAESVELLKQTSDVTDVTVDAYAQEIVETVGNFPLAISFIGAYLRSVPITARSYAERQRASCRCTNSPTVTRQGSLDEQLSRIWQASFDEISENSKELILLCSLIGNTNIPIRLLQGGIGNVKWMTGTFMVD